jgi:hypothetical protein
MLDFEISLKYRPVEHFFPYRKSTLYFFIPDKVGRPIFLEEEVEFLVGDFF